MNATKVSMCVGLKLFDPLTLVELARQLISEGDRPNGWNVLADWEHLTLSVVDGDNFGDGMSLLFGWFAKKGNTYEAGGVLARDLGDELIEAFAQHGEVLEGR